MKKHVTVQQAAVKWGISDRRVRKLCADGKIAGAIKDGKSYRIPADAAKPADSRMRGKLNIAEKDIAGYLKWGNDIVGLIDRDNNVVFTEPGYNETVSLYTKGRGRWTSDQFIEFLAERIISSERRDIERILFRCGLSSYDVLRIAAVTRGIHAKDLLWVANSRDETLESVVSDVFESVFNRRIDLVGDSIDTPEGYNIKRYGVYNRRYGIYKQRISPLTTDAESEVAVYLLSKKLGVSCCPAYMVDKDTVFSEFMFDFASEYIVHFRRLFDGTRSDNEYRNLLSVRPQYKDDFTRMILLDFITRQDDRHLSNIAIKVSGENESFYPLYDNGRCLFYEDTQETVRSAVRDIAGYSTGFGYSGTYYDHVREIASERGGLSDLVDLNIGDEEIHQLLLEAGFTGYRLEGAAEWIIGCIGIVRRLPNM